MLTEGFISLHRSLLKWEWYDDINTTRLFIHLLLTVNYYESEWRGIKIMRGQILTSIPKLAKETQQTIQQTRTAITHLVSTNEITCLSTPQYTVITVLQYDKFQTPTDKTTDEQQTNSKKSTDEQQLINKANKAIINKTINYADVFDFYMTLDLMKHKVFTKAMSDAIAKAVKNNRYSIDDCKMLLKRHSEIVKITAKNEKPITARGLDVFFGQKAYQAQHLICSEYADGGGIYERYKKETISSPFKSSSGGAFQL